MSNIELKLEGELGFELMTSDSDTILNHHLS
jgi:hypothetical protein